MTRRLCQILDEARTLSIDSVLIVLSPDFPTTDCSLFEVYQDLARSFIEALPKSPSLKYEGRGVVICAGGVRYLACAWVCIRMLRHLGCTLPIQVWHLGEREMPPEMASLLSEYGVETVDAEIVSRMAPVRTLGGWELKPYAILHSPFREVLLLDADNVSVVDPETLFEMPEYIDAGAVFWPDFGCFAEDHPIWEICKVPYRYEPEFESGQILIDKEKCWRPLMLTMHLNEHSDFYYRYILGDKDTFHMAWRMLDAPYAMPERPIEALQHTMCQHNFLGERIFQHRNFAKWSLFQKSPQVVDFTYEELCERFLQELKGRWHPDITEVPRYDPRKRSAGENDAAQQLVAGSWIYERIGYDCRPMNFNFMGLVTDGIAANEIFWDIRQSGNDFHLSIASETKLTCKLRKDPAGNWNGRWLIGERMPITVRKRD